MIPGALVAWKATKTFVKANPKVIKGVLIAAAVGVAWWQFTSWRDNLVKDADAAGFERARAAYQQAVEKANEREAVTQGRLDQMVVAFGALGTQREQQIHLTLKPIIEGIQNEVATDPRYRQCAVSGGMLDSLNAGRAAVDASIAASNPEGTRP